MPLRLPSGDALFTPDHVAWLCDIVNEKHERNWAKIQRFETALADMRLDKQHDDDSTDDDASLASHPRRYDVIGDVAVLRSAVTENAAEVGLAVMRTNGRIRLVVAPVPTRPGAPSRRFRRARFRRHPVVFEQLFFHVQYHVPDVLRESARFRYFAPLELNQKNVTRHLVVR